MQVQGSSINLSSNYSKTRTQEENETLRKWDDRFKNPQQFKNQNINFEDAKKTHQINTDDEFIEDSKVRMMAQVLERLTGKRIKPQGFKNWLQKDTTASKLGDPLKTQNQEQELLGWGIDYKREKIEKISQSLDVQAEGSITLADDTKIDFMMGFSLKQEEVNYEVFRLQAGDALKDPLVINYDGGMAELSSVKHKFDLDMDGEEDEISFVKEGSGFLAMDKNSNGSIDDGSELFGPKTDNGFEELREYDDDKNGWIDENDAVFEKLLIWTKDDDGSENLYSLKDKGVGAIYLNDISTEFDYGNKLDGYDGKLKATSVFVGEDKRIGSVQEIDLKM
jgi:hypothetical protein